MKAKIVLAALAALFLIILCSCQPTPESAVVTSKNDGALEAALEATADAPAEAPEDVPASFQEGTAYTGSFSNTDGDITYNVSLEIPADTAPIPVLRVRPKTITAETAKHVAEVLFGGADIFEYSGKPTKAELEEKILEERQHLEYWNSTYTGDWKLTDTEGGTLKDMMVEQLERAIANYEEEYATAPETVEAVPCAWEFHLPSWYYDLALVDEEQLISNNKTQYIVATAERDGLPYIYTVCNRDAADYRMHSITCEIDWLTAQEQGKQQTINSKQKPTEAELIELRAEAEAMLGAMDLGEWVIESCVFYLNTYDLTYTVTITAAPVYYGVKVSRQKQIEPRSDDAYASNYCNEEIVFTFSGSNLISFSYTGPLEVVEAVNENAAYLSFEEAMGICEKQLRLRLLTSYPYTQSDFLMASSSLPPFFSDEFSQTVRKDVEIYQAELGLARVRIKDNAEDFYLLPAYTFRASFLLFDQNGRVVADSDLLNTTGSLIRSLLVVNALDGSVIDTELGY